MVSELFWRFLECKSNTSIKLHQSLQCQTAFTWFAIQTKPRSARYSQSQPRPSPGWCPLTDRQTQCNQIGKSNFTLVLWNHEKLFLTCVLMSNRLLKKIQINRSPITFQVRSLAWMKALLKRAFPMTVKHTSRPNKSHLSNYSWRRTPSLRSLLHLWSALTRYWRGGSKWHKWSIRVLSLFQILRTLPDAARRWSEIRRRSLMKSLKLRKPWVQWSPNLPTSLRRVV